MMFVRSPAAAIGRVIAAIRQVIAPLEHDDELAGGILEKTGDLLRNPEVCVRIVAEAVTSTPIVHAAEITDVESESELPRPAVEPMCAVVHRLGKLKDRGFCERAPCAIRKRVDAGQQARDRVVGRGSAGGGDPPIRQIPALPERVQPRRCRAVVPVHAQMIATDRLVNDQDHVGTGVRAA